MIQYVYLKGKKKKGQDEKCVLSPLGKRHMLALVVVSPDGYLNDRTPWLRMARSHTGDGACSQEKQQRDFSLVMFNK